MLITYNIILFLITFIGGSIPLWIKKIDDNTMQYLLAFSGSFLLSITLLHLLPETFEELGPTAGLFLLIGFFIQLLIQRLTHGAEHGHTHIHTPHDHDHAHGHSHDHGHSHASIPLTSIMIGLAIHAFMEGLPLGFNYRMGTTEPALFMAVGAHKIPEAILVTSLVLESTNRSKSKSLLILATFSLLTPLSGITANILGMNYQFVADMVISLIPIVAGAFIHISTTIFFESGTKQHMLTRKKTIAIVIGVCIGLLTLLSE